MKFAKKTLQKKRAAEHAESAEHAVSLLEQANIVGGFGQYGLHWMIADAEDSYIVEIIGGKLTVSRNEYDFMTNFYMNYGPVHKQQTAAGNSFEYLPLLNDQAIGVERWAYLRDHYESCGTAAGMAQLMKDVRATAVYSQSGDELWLTEFTGSGLTIHNGREGFLQAAAEQKEMHEHHDRAHPAEDWITWHTAVYDMAGRTLTLWSQEDYDTPFTYALG